MNKYYYYKAINGTGYWKLKEPLFKNDESKVEITEQEWNSHHAEKESSMPHFSEAELAKKRQIASLKRELANTDWVVIKIAEETDAEKIAALREKYAEVIAHRISVRAQINALEEE